MARSNTLETAYFQEQLTLTRKMVEVLRYSFERAEPIVQGLKTNATTEISMESAEILEALTARFARLTDILTQKLFRTIDALELTDEGSLIDRFNRMEKRNIVTHAEQLIEIRKLRNQIAHDYVLEDLIPLYQMVFQQCNLLFGIVEGVVNYGKEKGWNL